jgi:hypothetical protein
MIESLSLASVYKVLLSPPHSRGLVDVSLILYAMILYAT